MLLSGASSALSETRIDTGLTQMVTNLFVLICVSPCESEGEFVRIRA